MPGTVQIKRLPSVLVQNSALTAGTLADIQDDPVDTTADTTWIQKRDGAMSVDIVFEGVPRLPPRSGLVQPVVTFRVRKSAAGGNQVVYTASIGLVRRYPTLLFDAPLLTVSNLIANVDTFGETYSLTFTNFAFSQFRIESKWPYVEIQQTSGHASGSAANRRYLDVGGARFLGTYLPEKPFVSVTYARK